MKLPATGLITTQTCALRATRKGDWDAVHQREVIEGVFDTAQKRTIVEKLTDAMIAIEGGNMRSVTWSVVAEVRSDDWGIGGKPLTTADVKSLAAGQPAAR